MKVAFFLLANLYLEFDFVFSLPLHSRLRTKLLLTSALEVLLQIITTSWKSELIITNQSYKNHSQHSIMILETEQIVDITKIYESFFKYTNKRKARQWFY